MRSLRLRLHPGQFSICRLPAGTDVRPQPGFFSVTHTPSETSVVCVRDAEPAGSKVETGWSLIEFEGPFAFDETGILASVLAPLASAGIGIFALSTFDTDWLLLKAADLPRAIGVLEDAGHDVSGRAEIQ